MKKFNGNDYYRLDTAEKDIVRIRKECATELAEVNTKLNESRSELEQYRTKALKTLNEKDKLIAELKKSSANQDNDGIVSMELEQLRYTIVQGPFIIICIV